MEKVNLSMFTDVKYVLNVKICLNYIALILVTEITQVAADGIDE